MIDENDTDIESGEDIQKTLCSSLTPCHKMQMFVALTTVQTFLAVYLYIKAPPYSWIPPLVTAALTLGVCYYTANYCDKDKQRDASETTRLTM